MEWFFKNVTTGKRPDWLFKKYIQDNGIEEGVGMITGKQQGPFFRQHFRFGNDDTPAEYIHGGPNKNFEEPVEQIVFLP